MKLLNRTGLYFIGFSFLMLLLSGVGIFYALDRMLDHEMDESLYHTRMVLHRELSKMDSLPSTMEVMDEVIDIEEVPSASDIEWYRDTFRMVKEEDELELEPFRQYIYTDQIKGKFYRIALNHSKFWSEHLLTVITGVVSGFLLLFFLILNFFNRFLSQKIWQPFYHTINQIRQFSFFEPKNLATQQTSIEEFKVLNDALLQMTSKLTKDYRSLQRFTENASHEIQTPLAIICSQVDLLLQNEQSKTDLNYIQQIQKSVNKLSKLNQSLLVLSRIENRQFEAKENIELGQVIRQKLESMEILVVGKNLTVEKDISEMFVFANPVLIDMVITNLLSNAIRHNISSGIIQISLNTKALKIKNTGLPLAKETTALFERFQKSDDAGKTIGLGLAIVKEICDLYQWNIDYRKEEEWHELKIEFSH